MIFAAYFILKGRDTHVNFLRLLFMVGISLATVLLFPLCDQARPWFGFSSRTSSVAGLAFFLVAT